MYESHLRPLEERYRIQAALGYFYTTKWDLVTSEFKSNLENTKCTAKCTGCGVVFETEAHFARHYYVPDVLYTNLGNCPSRVLNIQFVPCAICTGNLYREDHTRGCPDPHNPERVVPCGHELCSYYRCGD